MCTFSWTFYTASKDILKGEVCFRANRLQPFVPGLKTNYQDDENDEAILPAIECSVRTNEQQT